MSLTVGATQISSIEHTALLAYAREVGALRITELDVHALRSGWLRVPLRRAFNPSAPLRCTCVEWLSFDDWVKRRFLL